MDHLSFDTHLAGTWGKIREIAVGPGTDAWYPTAETLADSSLAVAWSARSDMQVTLDTRRIFLEADFDHSGCVDMREAMHTRSSKTYVDGRFKEMEAKLDKIRWWTIGTFFTMMTAVVFSLGRFVLTLLGK